jgi:hypothetical protein
VSACPGRRSPGGIVCLLGVGSADAGGEPTAVLTTEAVLGNLVVFGSVNANRRHYYRAARALAAADRGWLEQLITRRTGRGGAWRSRREGVDVQAVRLPRRERPAVGVSLPEARAEGSRSLVGSV